MDGRLLRTRLIDRVSPQSSDVRHFSDQTWSKWIGVGHVHSWAAFLAILALQTVPDSYAAPDPTRKCVGFGQVTVTILHPPKPGPFIGILYF